MRLRGALTVLVLLPVLHGCAELNRLGGLVQPPRFQHVPDQPAEIRLLGTSGAGVRLWARVSNPNAFGLRLGTLRGTLFLSDSRAADADFPLGLPLAAGGEQIIPIDISIRFSDLPGLSGVGRRILARESVPYRLEGTIGVDAGRLGQPVFGPMTLLRGETRGGQGGEAPEQHAQATRITPTLRPAAAPSPR